MRIDLQLVCLLAVVAIAVAKAYLAKLICFTLNTISLMILGLFVVCERCAVRSHQTETGKWKNKMGPIFYAESTHLGSLCFGWV